MIRLAAILAGRELRGGLRGFGVFLACLALGVAAIAAAGSLNAALDRTLSEEARTLLGGDVELRLNYQPPGPEEAQFLERFGTSSVAAEMRAMARTADGSRQSLVELKAVDGRYPLYGQVDLDPSRPLAAALSRHGDAYGAAADPGLLDRLGLKPGDRIRLGDAWFVLTAAIRHEPDRVATAFSLGPRLLIAREALPATGLLQPGSVVRYADLIRLDRGVPVAAFRQAVAERFPDAGWQIRDAAEAAPGVKRFLDHLGLFLTLVGLTALLVGGIGVANGVKAFLDGRASTIATLKCLGASRRLVVAVYFLQVGLLALLGIALGLAAGALLPWLLASLLGNRLPVAPHLAVYPLPLALAAGFGILTSLAFASWPLARAGRVPAARLLRGVVAGDQGRPGGGALAVIAGAGGALAALAIVSAADRGLAGWFVAGALVAMLCFAAAGIGLVRLSRRIARRWTGGPLAWRLALSSLHRPGAPTAGVVLSLGLGLTVLVAVGLVQANLSRQIDQRLPVEAPSFFFIDIQPDQVAAFDRAARAAGAIQVRKAPMVRGRITRIDGVPAEQATVAPNARWAVRGDRGLSVAAERPDHTDMVAGAWWPADYDGPPLVSLDAGIARGFGVTVGQTITVNVLGREITARIANLRDIDWSNLSMNFAFILSPNALAGAPTTFIATLVAPPGGESAIERAVSEALPNVSTIRVKEALDAVRQVIDGVGTAVRLAAAVTLAAGGLVLAGAIAAGQRRRTREAVLMKVLGARRTDLLRSVLIEHGLLGLATGLVAAVLGSLAAWAVLVGVLKVDWVFLPGPVAAIVGLAVAAIGGLGVAATRRALAVGPAPYLRNE